MSIIRRVKPQLGRGSPYKWVQMTDQKCKDAMRMDFVVHGMTTREIFNKYNKLLVHPFKYNSMRTLFGRWGWYAARKVVMDKAKVELGTMERVVKKQARAIAKRTIERPSVKLKEETEKKAALALAKKAKDRIVEGGERHFDRMEKIIDKAHGVIEGMEPTTTNVDEYLNVSDKFDKLGRRLYNMDDQKPLDSHQLNVAVLIGTANQSTDDDDVIDV